MIPGFYIAQHPWLESAGLHKVGHTGDLRRRLTDDAYKTCFPEGWSYRYTLETADKRSAERLERHVLNFCAADRVDGRELVKTPLPKIIAAALKIAKRKNISCSPRVTPIYASCERGEREDSGCREDNSEDSGEDGSEDSSEDGSDDSSEVSGGDEGEDGGVDSGSGEGGGKGSGEVINIDDLCHKMQGLSISEFCDVGEMEEEPARPSGPLEVRQYQQDAVDACLAVLSRDSRAILQMACRCGKTAAASLIMCKYRRALFLVPSLALARQTLIKLASYGHHLGRQALLVGSDPLPIRIGDQKITMTTSPSDIAQFLATPGEVLVVSTYQSSQLVIDSRDRAPFDLVVFDEAHRVCGGGDERAFNAALLAPQEGARLFMTATPAYDATAVTMRDTVRFGGVAYRYHLRQGMEAGYVNTFRLELLAAPRGTACEDLVVAAMGRVDKLLVFCRDIAHVNDLAKKCRDLAKGGSDPAARQGFEVFTAHSQQNDVAEQLRAFNDAKRAVLFNVRMFQEGVEIPTLNAVLFTAPRHSSRDIIQSVCRPLNALPGKPESVVFLPVEHEGDASSPQNLKRYSTIVPFLDALLDEDPRLYDHLLDPAGVPYPLGVVGVHTLGLEREEDRQALLAAVRRVARHGTGAKTERLLRCDRIPWERGYAALRHVVERCQRYPKTTDLYIGGTMANAPSCSLHSIYRHYADRYREGGLEPYQAAALEALPGWIPYGVEGPYPWGLCMDYLERWLDTHDNVPPPCDIHQGGYVGLDATPMERLSGALTCINQGDGNRKRGSGMVVDAGRAAYLDALCARRGLVWRKERGKDGMIVENAPPTFIQESYSRFKAISKRNPRDPYIREHFPGWPHKHKRQENLDVLKNDKASIPPRKRKVVVKRPPKGG